jgi:long-chain acyl-CoA synthetase
VQHPWDRRLGVWWLAEDHPDAPAVLESPTDQVLTFGELAARAHQVVHALRSAGLRVGDIVAYALPNDVDMIVWQLACSESGLLSLALNPALTTAELSEILERSRASALVAHASYADRVAAIDPGPSIRLRVAVGGSIPGFVEQPVIIEGAPATEPLERRLGGPVSYSSGTTGKPKGIWRRFPDVDPSVAADAQKTFAQAFQFQPLEGAHLVSAGMHHGGCQSFYLGALAVGQPLVIMDRFDAEGALQRIERHRVTTAYMVPTQFVRLLRLPSEVRARYDLSSLQSVVHSAAPCPLAIKQQMFDWWGPVIWETYGGMEGAATIAKPHRWLEKPGTVGRPIRGMQVRILDDDGNELGPGEIGNVFLESLTGATFEYRDEPELTRSVHRGKAFTIGDVGYLDEDGYLFLCDRAKDMIISGGVNIYPAEAEAVLTTHPAVGDVAVIGVPDEEWGESVKAVVELVDGVEPSEELAAELLTFCRERLTGFKCPRTLEFRDELPRTETGKLFKRLLRDEHRAAVERSA